MKQLIFAAIALFCIGCYNPKYLDGELYYLTAVHQDKTVLWKDSLYYLRHDKYGSHLILYDSFEQKYKYIVMEEIIVKPVLKEKK